MCCSLSYEFHVTCRTCKRAGPVQPRADIDRSVDALRQVE